MKVTKFVIIWIIASTIGIGAQIRFGGAVVFKGKLEGNVIQGHNITIEAQKGVVKLTCKSNASVFKLNTEAEVLLDAVASRNCKSVAISMKVSNDAGDLRQCLATISDENVVRMANYTDRILVKDLGWVVELGAVSGDGRMILAKCAKFLPPDTQGVTRVNHVWAFLAIEGGKIKLIRENDLAELIEWPSPK